MQEDFNILIAEGTVAFYQSCEVTQIFLIDKKKGTKTNLFIIAVFEERPVPEQAYELLTKKHPIPLNGEYSVGIHRYWLNIEDAKKTFQSVLIDNVWDFKNDRSLIMGELKKLPKQFIGRTESSSINRCLKNNFHSGSYVLEFFDETKNKFDFLLDKLSLKIFNKLCESIKNIVPVDLSVLRDRVGNIIFQFPINILDIHSKRLSGNDGVRMYFAWHDRVKTRPDCCIEITSTFDNNYMGATLIEYDKKDTMDIMIGNIDQKINSKIWDKKKSNLILHNFDGVYLKGLDLNMGIINHEPRLFEINGEQIEVQVTSQQRSGLRNDRTYLDYINARLYESEREVLERNLAFKQYAKGMNQQVEAIQDIRDLIKRNDEDGVYLWDPFLRPEDIFQTLYFSDTSGVALKAIGAINSTVKMVYQKKEVSTEDLINQYRKLFNNPKHNNYGLNLEFRCQFDMHGWGFHDRFIMFPGNGNKKPKAYSLGTSINSLGKEHHILQEVSSPQRIIDAFDELWDKLNKLECIVWKSGKI